MEPGHKSQGFGRQKADLTCIWSGWWPGGSAAGKWTPALLGLILTCLSSTSTSASSTRWHRSVMPHTPPTETQRGARLENIHSQIHVQPCSDFFLFFCLCSCVSGDYLVQEETNQRFKKNPKQSKLFKKKGGGRGETWRESGKTTEITNVLSKRKKKKKKTRKKRESCLTGEVFLFVHQSRTPTSNI